jgi:N-acetylmuramoyl-L-alanine amidase
MHAIFWAALLLQTPVPASTGGDSDRDPAPPYVGVDYVDLDLLARRYSVTWTSDAATAREILRSGEFVIVLAPNLETALVNGAPRKLVHPVKVADGRVRVPVEIARLVDGTVAVRPVKTEPRKEPVSTAPKKKWFTVVLDPGHGGMHTGCKGRSGVLEKDLTLDMALRLRTLLEAAGGEVVMVRTDDRHFNDDVHRDLQHRCDLVNRTRPDLFLSIHVNYVPRPEPRGFEMWVRKNDRASRELASYLRAEFGRALSTDDRGIKDEKNLYVLRNTSCPAVLVEVGFISNPAEERELCDPKHRQKLAATMAEAVQRYLAARK